MKAIEIGVLEQDQVGLKDHEENQLLYSIISNISHRATRAVVKAHGYVSPGSGFEPDLYAHSLSSKPAVGGLK